MTTVPNRPLAQVSLAVVGVDFPNKDGSNRRLELALCKPGDPVELRLEPKNRFDKRAVGVFSSRGAQIGYLRAARSGRIARLIRAGRELRAIFQGVREPGACIRVAFNGEQPELPHEEARQRVQGPVDIYQHTDALLARFRELEAGKG